jgi:hypothetical protein
MLNLIRYNSRLRHIWDVLIISCTIVSVFLISYQAVFIRARTIEVDLFIYLLDLFFVAAMWVSAQTSFKRFGVEVLDKKQIRERYLKKSFIWDLIGVIPFEWLALPLIDQEYGIQLFILLRLIRLIRIRYVIIIYRKWESESWSNSAMIRIMRLLTLVILLSHLIACSWFYSSHSAGYPEDSWVNRENLIDASPARQYLRSIYWSITSMTTVGYGDITPRRSAEYIISIVVMAIGASSYAFIIGNIASLFSNLDISRTRHQNKVDSVFHFLNAREVKPELIDQVNNYYEYIWEKRRGLNESELFNDLPDSLRLELLKDLLKDQLNQVPLFRFSPENIKNELLKALELAVYSPQSYVVNYGELGDAMYFISKGHVEVLDKNGEKKEEMTQGDYMGDLSLILKEHRSGSARCLDFVEVFILSEAHFTRIKKDYSGFTGILKEVSKNRSEKALSLLLNDIIL